jgi:hypothetical protein
MSSEGLGQLEGVLEVRRLHEERVCAECVGLVDIVNVVGGGQHDNGEMVERRHFSQPRKDFEAVNAGQFQV